MLHPRVRPKEIPDYYRIDPPWAERFIGDSFLDERAYKFSGYLRMSRTVLTWPKTWQPACEHHLNEFILFQGDNRLTSLSDRLSTLTTLGSAPGSWYRM